jgi:hypothetical protein
MTSPLSEEFLRMQVNNKAKNSKTNNFRSLVLKTNLFQLLINRTKANRRQISITLWASITKL